MKAYTLNPPPNSLLQIDIIIEESLKFEVFVKRSILKKMGKVNIPVVAIDDIMAMKRKTGRERDKLDLQVLKNLSQL